MRKVMNKINFAIIVIMSGAPAMAATNDGLCDLLREMHGVFSLLRTLAFVGAAFVIAGWAWDYISSGKAELKDIKGKGTALLVGFILLFSIGILLSFLMSQGTAGALGCAEDILKKW